MLSVHEMLDHFGYTEDWLRLGIVTEPGLRQQLTEYDNSYDKNKEHYRHHIFQRYVDKLESISNELLEELIHLRDVGSDACDLRLNRVLDLVNSMLLTDEQLHSLLHNPTFSENQGAKSFRIAVRRLLLQRRISAEGITDETFAEVCDLNDDPTHRFVLARDDLEPNHLLWIFEHGCNRAVRNLAKQSLRRHGPKNT